METGHADGSPSRTYCSHCYASGRFTLPDIIAHEMQARVRDKLASTASPGCFPGSSRGGFRSCSGGAGGGRGEGFEGRIAL